MMSQTLTQSPSQQVKICSKCQIEKPVSKFHKKLANSDNRASACAECVNKSRREYRQTEAYKAQQQFPRVKEARVKSKVNYEKSDKARERYRRYATSEKGRASGRRSWRNRKIREIGNELFLIADIPAPIILPYVQSLQARFASATERVSNVEFSGMNLMRELTGVPDTAIRKVLNGKKDRMPLEYCDNLSLHGDFTTQQLYDEALEWALETSNEWPIGYEPRGYSKQRPSWPKYKEDVYAYIRRRKREAQGTSA
jgi:hypothetical protein